MLAGGIREQVEDPTPRRRETDMNHFLQDFLGRPLDQILFQVLKLMRQNRPAQEERVAGLEDPEDQVEIQQAE